MKERKQLKGGIFPLLLSLAFGVGSLAMDAGSAEDKAREEARALREAEAKNNMIYQQEMLNLKLEQQEKNETEMLLRAQNANTDRLNREQVAIQRDAEKRQLDALRTRNLVEDSANKRTETLIDKQNLLKARQSRQKADASALRIEAIKREAQQQLARQRGYQMPTMANPAQPVRRMPKVIRAPTAVRRGGSKTQDISYLRSALGLTAKDARLIYDIYSPRG